VLEVLVHAITRVSLSTCLMLDSHGHQHYGGKRSSLLIPSCSHFSFLFRIHVPWYNSSCSHSISYSSTIPIFCVHRGIHKPQISRHISFLLHPTPPPSNTTSTSIYLPNTFYLSFGLLLLLSYSYQHHNTAFTISSPGWHFNLP